MTSILFIEPVSTVTADYVAGVVYSVDDTFAAQMIAAGHAQVPSAFEFRLQQFGYIGPGSSIGAVMKDAGDKSVAVSYALDSTAGVLRYFVEAAVANAYMSNWDGLADMTFDDLGRSFPNMLTLQVDYTDAGGGLTITGLKPELTDIVLTGNGIGATVYPDFTGIGHLPKLIYFNAAGIDFPAKDDVYIGLESATRGGLPNGEINTSGCGGATVTSASATARAALLARGWDLFI